MAAEINKEELRKELIEIYEGYIKNNKDNAVKSKAQKLFLEYTYMGNVLDKVTMNAIRGLEHIGFEFGRTSQKGAWMLNQEEAQEILKSLRV